MSDTFRQDKLKDFTVIRNAIFKDYRLSAKAKGVACQLLSLPPTWDFSIKGICTLFSDGESSIRSALAELEEYGYLHREREREAGKLGKCIYVITDDLKCEKPNVENPHVENPRVDNQAQLNTKEYNTEELNIKELIHIPGPRIAEIKREFEVLWDIYPKKQGKDKAYGYYERARKSGTTYEEVENGINAYMAYIRANDVDAQYVKMGSTFFSQKAWGDDWSIRNKPKGSANQGSHGSRRELFARLYEEHKDDI